MKKSKQSVYNHLKEDRVDRKQERKDRRVMTKAICKLSKELETKNGKLAVAALELDKQKKKCSKVKKSFLVQDPESSRQIEMLEA